MLEKTLEGKRNPGEHRPDERPLARVALVTRTDSRGEQSFEVGVPAAESGEPDRSKERRARARLRVPDNV
jgi:hypothetical protein